MARGRALKVKTRARHTVSDGALDRPLLGDKPGEKKRISVVEQNRKIVNLLEKKKNKLIRICKNFSVERQRKNSGVTLNWIGKI